MTEPADDALSEPPVSGRTLLGHRLRDAHPQPAPPGSASSGARVDEHGWIGASSRAGWSACPARPCHRAVGRPPARRRRRPALTAVAASVRCAGTSRSCRSRSTTPSARPRRSGGSVNDFFVAGAAGGAGAYHRELGADVDELRISMPVSTRTDRSVGGNAFSVDPVAGADRRRTRSPGSPRSTSG